VLCRRVMLRQTSILPIVTSLWVGACTHDPHALSADDGFDDTVDDGKADDSATAPRVVHYFTDADLFPEGGAFDPVERAFFVGSLRHGSVTRVAADGSESIFYPGSGESGRLTLGMQVDPLRRRLWVCTTKDSIGRVWIFDLLSGQRTADIDLTTANSVASCNDVLVLDDGRALVSDRENPYIYVVDASGNVAVWAQHPLLKGRVISLNSMDFTEDRSAVLTATYLPPALVRVSMADPSDVREVELDGDMFMDGFNLLNGPDDLVMHDGELVVAFGSSLKRVVPNDASWHSATVTSTRTIGGVTALVEDGASLVGINGQSVRFALGISPRPFQIFEVDPDELR
jgi:sugar lactone lactonase YvrE